MKPLKKAPKFLSHGVKSAVCSSETRDEFPLAATRHIRCFVMEAAGAAPRSKQTRLRKKKKKNTTKSTAMQWGSMMSLPECRVKKEDVARRL